MSLRSLTQMLKDSVPHQASKPLPPLVPISAKVTMDPHARLPSTWRPPIGKYLTSRRIAEYQREGRYGSSLLLPPIKGAPCCVTGCKVETNTRKCNYSYLPKPGVYCITHRKEFRDARHKELEEQRKWKEAMTERREQEYI